MAIPAVNLTYLGAGPSATGTITSNFQGGPSGKTLLGMGTATLDGAATTFTVNWLDGVQKPFGKLAVVQLQAAAAASGGNTVYTTLNAGNQIPNGTSVTIAGFSNSANNGTFTVQSATATTITLNNGSGVVESNNPAATLTCVIGGTPIAAVIDRASNSATGTADTAAFTIIPNAISSISATGGTVTLSGAGSNGNLLSFVVEILFAS